MRYDHSISLCYHLILCMTVFSTTPEWSEVYLREDDPDWLIPSYFNIAETHFTQEVIF
jgi:hypothetical protein